LVCFLAERGDPAPGAGDAGPMRARVGRHSDTSVALISVRQVCMNEVSCENVVV
jgi:hypothetical protein